MRKLDPSDRDRGGAEGVEALHRGTSTLDRAVVLLDPVVEVLQASHSDTSPERVLTAKRAVDWYVAG